MKKKAVLFSITLLFACAAITGAIAGQTAYAETPGGGLYVCFNGVTAVYGDDGGFAVADEDGFYFFKNGAEKVAIPELTGSNALFGDVDGRFALCGGKVYAYTVDAPESGAFTPQEIIADESFVVRYAALSDSAIYCASADEIRKYDAAGVRDQSFVSPKLGGKNVTGLAAASGKVYYSVPKNRNYADVYEADGELFATLKSDGAIAGGGNALYSIMRDGSAAIVTDGGVETVAGRDFAVAIYADKNGSLYYATDVGEAIFYDSATGSEKVLAASESARDGYYAQPSFATARMGKLVVCDTLNDRLAVLGSGDRSIRSVKVVGGKETISYNDGEYRTISRPSSAFIDNNGKVYVAYAARKIAVFNQNLSVFDTYSCPDTVAGKITALTGDNANDVYALVGGGVYKVTFSGGNAEFRQIASGAGAAVFAAGGDRIYYSIGSAVYSAASDKIDEAIAADSEISGEAVFTASGTIRSLAIDRGGNVFYTVDNADETEVMRHDEASDELVATIPSTGAKVAISLAQAGGAGYGDLIVTDNGNSRVLIYDGGEAHVDLSVGAVPELRPFDSENIIRNTAVACSIYGTPNETDALTFVTADVSLVVARYDVPGFPDYSYVYYDDKITGKLVRGFAFRSNLAEPLGYSEPPAGSGYVYSGGNTIYDMPSFYGDAPESGDIVWQNVPKNTTVTLLPFNDYTAGNTRWYRVTAERDGEAVTGYIPVGAVSVRGFVPDSIRPQYNAVIKSYNGSLGAKTYSLTDDGKYVEMEKSFLLNGTKVEVVGAFDTSEKYTQIKYFDERLGTCSCYVETVYIDYNNVSVVQIVAIVIAVVTAILLVILLVRIYMKKRKI